MKNSGKSSEKTFEASFGAMGKRAFLHRVEDASDLHGRNKKLVLTTKKPSDYVVTENGEMYYAEVKSSESKTSFPFSAISTNQWASARRQVAAGGKFFFFVHNVITNQWFKLPATHLLSITDRKSVRWDTLNQFLWEPIR